MGILGNTIKGMFGLGRSLWAGGAEGTLEQQCPEGYMYDVATGGNVCIADLVIDRETGELISPAEYARRKSSGELVWDAVSSEWVTPRELRSRDSTRTREARDERRRRGQEVFDHPSGEWMTPNEQRRRQAERDTLRRILFAKGIVPEALPRLSRFRGGIIRETGVAEPTAPAKPDADAGALDYLRDLVGPEKREEESKGRKALVVLAYMAAILAAIVFTRTRSAS